VTDTNQYALTNQSISVTNTFKIVVWEVNTAPFFTNNPPTNFVAILTTMIVTNTATDTDSPPNTLTYTLLNPPTNAVINPTNGIITWTPSAAFANTTNTITTIVTDFNPFALTNQHLSATNSFVVIVLVPPYSATLAATSVTGTSAQLNGFATPNGSPAYAWFEWGVNTLYGNQTTPVPVGSSSNVVYVTSSLTNLSLPQGYHFRLAVSNNAVVTRGFDHIFDVGSITAWGDTTSGLTNVPAILTNTAVAIAAGSADNLALMNNGIPIAWGDNSSGPGQTNVPASLTNAVAITSGTAFNLALKNNGQVVGWGNNSFNQTNVPANISNVVAIAAGSFHGLALKTNGTVATWGITFGGVTNVPVGLSNVVAVAGGNLHSLALKNDGTVVAWGNNASGQTTVPAGLSNVVAVAAGSAHSLALKSDGTVVAWGATNNGQTSVPAGLSNVVAIASDASANFSLALKSDGTVIAWGDGLNGDTNVPASLINVAAVAAGGSHSLALVSATPINSVNTAPFFILPNPPNQTMNVGATLTVTNTAHDTDSPPQILLYTLPNQPAWVMIDPNHGYITLTPTAAQAGTITTITTIVTDNGVPPLSATNSFLVSVNPIPFISSVTITNNGVNLQWFAPATDKFNLQWSTNLASGVWTYFQNGASPTNITFNGTSFSFTDTNAQFMAEFYRLILLP
jgi:hypothetical protein